MNLEASISDYGEVGRIPGMKPKRIVPKTPPQINRRLPWRRNNVARGHAFLNQSPEHQACGVSIGST